MYLLNIVVISFSNSHHAAVVEHTNLSVLAQPKLGYQFFVILILKGTKIRKISPVMTNKQTTLDSSFVIINFMMPGLYRNFWIDHPVLLFELKYSYY